MEFSSDLDYFRSTPQWLSNFLTRLLQPDDAFMSSFARWLIDCYFVHFFFCTPTKYDLTYVMVGNTNPIGLLFLSAASKYRN